MQRLDDPYATMSPFSTKDGVTDEGAFNAGVQSRIDWVVAQRALTKRLGKAVSERTGQDRHMDWLADQEHDADFGAVLTSVSANIEMVSPTTWEALEKADVQATAERVGSPSEHRDKAAAALGIESPMSEKDFMEGPLAEPVYWPKPGPQGELASRLLSIVSPAYRQELADHGQRVAAQETRQLASRMRRQTYVDLRMSRIHSGENQSLLDWDENSFSAAMAALPRGERAPFSVEQSKAFSDAVTRQSLYIGYQDWRVKQGLTTPEGWNGAAQTRSMLRETLSHQQAGITGTVIKSLAMLDVNGAVRSYTGTDPCKMRGASSGHDLSGMRMANCFDSKAILGEEAAWERDIDQVRADERAVQDAQSVQDAPVASWPGMPDPGVRSKVQDRTPIGVGSSRSRMNDLLDQSRVLAQAGESSRMRARAAVMNAKQDSERGQTKPVDGIDFETEL
jgi:hypothetical protein